jgi:hypothetical protein
MKIAGKFASTSHLDYLDTPRRRFQTEITTVRINAAAPIAAIGAFAAVNSANTAVTS